jgi:signal transduction histidine kinase
VLNLLSNAAKFCAAERGEVAIELSLSGGVARVDVRDNGPGLAADDQQVIFEKFRQRGDAMTDRPQGTGLGLSISRQIVAHLGGELWVSSVPGSGATFSFTLPLARAGDPVGVDSGGD